MNNYNVIAYAVYLPTIILITIWVAHTLYKNGSLFLIDIFHGNSELASSVNKLLLTGFYLINIGYAAYTLRISTTISDTQLLIEMLSKKLGTIILILGCMHYFNLFIFYKLRKRAIAPKIFRSKYTEENA